MDADAVIEDLRRRLKSQPEDLVVVARRAELSYSWLVKFANGHVLNPYLRNLERLDRAITATEEGAL